MRAANLNDAGFWCRITPKPWPCVGNSTVKHLGVSARTFDTLSLAVHSLLCVIITR
jgi:hypothetical protein